ncbi:uncharacterized protein LOC129606482 [Condylostylus longicornis]|uniref:uncharacterized protein LOC129606482 n=1 Tax=Condylostylus longicornis TaxID=2530218 RepID=UPI00244E3BE2|nr:uncharacterized protein LOC129606482 [Condylostylus longicornis]
MKIFLTLFNVITLVSATIVTDADWKAYKVKHSIIFFLFRKYYVFLKDKYRKNYSLAEEEKSKVNYANNKIHINLHNIRANNGLVSYRLEENQYSDMSKTEFFEMLGGKNYSDTTPPPQRKETPVVLKKLSDPFLSYRNWTRDGAGYGVLDQGRKCNAAWAFSALSAIEAHYFQVAEDPMLPKQLSVQNLIDCAGGAKACNGLQIPETAYDYIEFQGNINTGENYKYTGVQSFCKYDPNDVGLAIGGFQTIDENMDGALLQIVAYETPVVVGFNPFSFEFMHYKSGIFVPPQNKIDIYHKYYMTVIGYGSDNGQDYWILKNSMSNSWGEFGYMRMIRSKEYPITKFASFANV